MFSRSMLHYVLYTIRSSFTFFIISIADSNVDPSLASMQRKLKKAKLTDELNEKIANRPGPLELVEQSILEAEDPLKTAIKG